MSTLDRRVSTLEQASAKTEVVSYIILVGIGEQDKELIYIYDNYGNNWHRRPDETEKAFSGRATSETPRNENQVAMLFGSSYSCVSY